MRQVQLRGDLEIKPGIPRKAAASENKYDSIKLTDAVLIGQKVAHMGLESDALKARTKNCQGNWSMWKDPWYCSDCGIWYPEFQLLTHKEHHAMPDQTLSVAQPGK